MSVNYWDSKARLMQKYQPPVMNGDIVEIALK
jgi:hypothetical protein